MTLNVFVKDFLAKKIQTQTNIHIFLLTNSIAAVLCSLLHEIVCYWFRRISNTIQSKFTVLHLYLYKYSRVISLSTNQTKFYKSFFLSILKILINILKYETILGIFRLMFQPKIREPWTMTSFTYMRVCVCPNVCFNWKVCLFQSLLLVFCHWLSYLSTLL